MIIGYSTLITFYGFRDALFDLFSGFNNNKYANCEDRYDVMIYVGLHNY